MRMRKASETTPSSCPSPGKLALASLRQLNMLEKIGGVSVPDLKHFNQVSVKLERFWGDQIRYQLFRYQL